MENIHPIFERLTGRKQKEQLLNQKACVFWLTGLSGSGKSTIAEKVERKLFNDGYMVQVLDGDNTRSGICKDLGFTLDERNENIRRIAELTKLLIHNGLICINSFVSPTKDIREMAKSIIGGADYYEVHVSASLEECEKRDVKGLYAKARSGQILNFTGIDSPYESPVKPALSIETVELSADQSAEKLFKFILEKVN